MVASGISVQRRRIACLLQEESSIIVYVGGGRYGRRREEEDFTQLLVHEYVWKSMYCCWCVAAGRYW